MTNYPKEFDIHYAPTEESKLYPETDGKPMAASDLHRHELMWTLQALEFYFSSTPEVYVSGDIMMYDIEGPDRTAISPDVLVTFGIGQKLRRTYKIWEEGKAPEFVMEFTSESTFRNDFGDKVDVYARMGICDYFLYDAEGLHLPVPVVGFTLMDDKYARIQPKDDGGVLSAALGLAFHARDKGLGIYDPVSETWLQTQAEAEAARAETAEARAENAEAHAVQETTRAENAEAHAEAEAARAETAEARAENAEAENARLREELARLQSGTSEP